MRTEIAKRLKQGWGPSYYCWPHKLPQRFRKAESFFNTKKIIQYSNLQQKKRRLCTIPRRIEVNEITHLGLLTFSISFKVFFFVLRRK